MNQRVITITRRTDELDLLRNDINSEIKALNNANQRVLSISTCNSTIVSNYGRELHQVTAFLLVEEIPH